MSGVLTLLSVVPEKSTHQVLTAFAELIARRLLIVHADAAHDLVIAEVRVVRLTRAVSALIRIVVSGAAQHTPRA